LAKEQEHPEDKSLANLRAALKNIREQVDARWLLTAEERSRVNIGLYAIRTLEGLHDDLVKPLTTLDSHLKCE
jgi:hypothetical protein